MTNIRSGFINLMTGMQTMRTGGGMQCMRQTRNYQSVKSVSINCFKLYAALYIFDGVFSDVLCLDTYRHGTNPYAAFRIILQGPDHSKCGKVGWAQYYKFKHQVESPIAQSERDRKAFYVLKETFCVMPFLACSRTFKEITREITRPKTMSKNYACKSTVGWIGSLLPLPENWQDSVGRQRTREGIKLARVLCYHISPVIKFHLDPYQSNITFFEDYCGCAMFTKDQLSPLDIGTLGVIKNGVNGNLFKRISNNKEKFSCGVVQLAAIVALRRCCRPDFINFLRKERLGTAFILLNLFICLHIPAEKRQKRRW